MIGMKIVTPQTTEDGKIVRRVYLKKDIKSKMNFIYVLQLIEKLVVIQLYILEKVE